MNIKIYSECSYDYENIEQYIKQKAECIVIFITLYVLRVSFYRFKF